MKKDNLTSVQFSCLIFFPILSLLSGMGMTNIIKGTGVDSYITVLIAYFLGVFLLLLFFYIFNYKKELNIIEKIKFLFGDRLGTIINYLINISIFIIGVVLIYNIGNFAISQFLSETPLFIFMVLFGLLIIYNVSIGIENISRVAFIFFIIICGLTIISTAGILPNFDSNNLKPFLENGIKEPLKNGIILNFTNTIPIFTLLIVAKDKIVDSKKVNKRLFIFFTISYLFAFLAILLTMGSLGIYLSKLYQYPEYTVLKKISLFNFIDRIENFIYIKWILNSAISLSLVVYYISCSIKKTSKKLLPTIIMGLIIGVSLYLFKDNTIFYNFSFYLFPYIGLFLFLIYMIIGINIFIRKRIEN